MVSVHDVANGAIVEHLDGEQPIGDARDDDVPALDVLGHLEPERRFRFQ